MNNCANCNHFYIDSDNFPNGRCWRYPPTLFAWPMPNQKGQMVVQEFSQYPPVKPTQGCGEHEFKLKLETAQ